MSYNTIYYSTFPDAVGSKIDFYIKQKDYAGASELLVLGSDPIIITTSNRDLVEPILGTGSTTIVLNSSTNLLKYANLFGNTEKYNYILITKDTSTKIFEGYIIPDLFSQEIKDNALVSLPGSNYLSSLDKHELGITQPNYIYTYTPAGFQSKNLLGEAIWSTDLSIDIAVNNTIYSDQIVHSDTSTLFDYILINRNLYLRENGQSEDCKFVIESLLKTFYSRLYYYDGKFYIERIKDLLTHNKKFVNYKPDGTRSSFTLPNDRISLCGENYLINQNTLEFETGKKCVYLNLRKKRGDNIINKNIWEVEVSTNDRPDYGKWIYHVEDEESVSSVTTERYSDRNILNGVKITDSDAINTPVQWDRFLTTKIPIHPAAFNRYTISYKYSFATQHGKDNRTYAAAFRLRTLNNDGITYSYAGRYTDPVTQETMFKWYDSRDFTSATRLEKSLTYFQQCFTQSDINPHTGVLEMNIDVDLTDLLIDQVYHDNFIDHEDTHRTTPSSLSRITYDDAMFAKYMYLDIHPLVYRVIYSNQGQNQTAGTRNKLEPTDVYDYYYEFNSPNPYPYYNNILPQCETNQFLGDVAIDTQIDEEADALKGCIEDDYIDTLTIDLDVFDVNNDIYLNGIYTIDPCNNLVKQKYWRDDTSINYLSIQKLLIQDLTQQFARPRYKLNIDVKSKDSSIFNMGQVFTYSYLKKDGSLMEFIPTGIEYNVQANSYRMNLIEAVSDIDYRIDASNLYPNVNASLYFEVSPSDLYFYASGAANPYGSNGVNVSTNTSWYATNTWGDAWIIYNGHNGVNNYFGNYDLSIFVEPNLAAYDSGGTQLAGFARDGSIIFQASGFTPYSLGNRWVTVHQEAGTPGLSLVSDKTLLTWDGSGNECLDSSLYLVTNTPWYVVYPAAWITGDVSGETTQVINFTVSVNSGAGRFGNVYIRAYADYGVYEGFTAIQSATGESC